MSFLIEQVKDKNQYKAGNGKKAPEFFIPPPKEQAEKSHAPDDENYYNNRGYSA